MAYIREGGDFGWVAEELRGRDREKEKGIFMNVKYRIT
jgi:hypothetical protein